MRGKTTLQKCNHTHAGKSLQSKILSLLIGRGRVNKGELFVQVVELFKPLATEMSLIK